MIHVFFKNSFKLFHAQNAGVWYEYLRCKAFSFKLWVNVFPGMYQVLFVGQMEPKYRNRDRHPVISS